MTPEALYTALLRDDCDKVKPGGRGSLTWTAAGADNGNFNDSTVTKSLSIQRGSERQRAVDGAGESSDYGGVPNGIRTLSQVDLPAPRESRFVGSAPQSHR